MSKAVAAELVQQRTALTQAGVLRVSRPGNVRVNAGVDLAHEDPVLLSAFYNLAAAHPRDSFTITSGARYKQPSSGAFPIAPQGHSLHDPRATGTGVGEALDAVENGRPIRSALGDAELALFGLHGTVPGDPVHLTLLGVNG